MKKILVILIALLFIGFAFAEEVPQNPGDAPPTPELYGMTGPDVLPALGLAEGNMPKVIAINTKARTKVQIEKMKTQYKAIRARVKDAKAEYVKAVAQYRDKKEDYLALAKKFHDANADMKKKYSAQIKVHAQGILSNQADALIKKLISLQDKNIAPEQAEDWITQLEEVRIIMDSNDVNREYVIATIKDIRDGLIPAIKYHSQMRAAHALNNKFQAIFNKSTVTVERTNNLIIKLAEKGYDTAGVVESLATFEEKIGEAKVKYEEARNLWADANTSIEKHEILKQGFEIAREVNKIIIEGFHDLKNALRELKAQSPTVETGPSEDEPIDVNNDGSGL
jgi:hypothetical protein